MKPRYFHYESNGYTFSLIEDEKGVRLYSAESLRDYTLKGLDDYCTALRSTKHKILELEDARNRKGKMMIYSSVE